MDSTVLERMFEYQTDTLQEAINNEVDLLRFILKYDLIDIKKILALVASESSKETYASELDRIREIILNDHYWSAKDLFHEGPKIHNQEGLVDGLIYGPYNKDEKDPFSPILFKYSDLDSQDRMNYAEITESLIDDKSSRYYQADRILEALRNVKNTTPWSARVYGQELITSYVDVMQTLEVINKEVANEVGTDIHGFYKYNFNSTLVDANELVEGDKRLLEVDTLYYYQCILLFVF